MEKYCFNQFNEKFSEFMIKINTNFKNDEELDNFNKKLHLVNPKKLIRRFVKTLKPFKDKLNNRDNTLFTENDIYVLPDVNMSRLWKLTNNEQIQKSIWQYLQMLYVLGEIVITGKTENLEMLDSMLQEVGSNTNNSQNNNLGGLDIGNLMKNFGVDKLDDQLSNINGEDISEASDNIKKMFSDNSNKSSGLMCDMVNDISSELSNSKTNGQGITGILKIAENVANKFKPKIESGEFDLSELLGSAQNVMSEMYKNDSQGNTPNPMNMMQQLMGNMNSNNQNDNNPMNLLQQLMGGLNIDNTTQPEIDNTTQPEIDNTTQPEINNNKK